MPGYRVLQTSMIWPRFVWVVKCILLCLLGVFVTGRLAGLLNPLVWWIFHQSGTSSLQRSLFTITYYLPLVGFYGFVLGLIPIHRLQRFLASSFGRFQFKPKNRIELVAGRPLLWAWVPIGLALAYRLLTFSLRRDHSVLGPMPQGETLCEHFFAPLNPYSSLDTSAWMINRFVFTSPTLFLFAYAVGVWLRRQFPKPVTSPANDHELSTG